MINEKTSGLSRLFFLTAVLVAAIMVGPAWAADGAKKIRLAYAGWELWDRRGVFGSGCRIVQKHDIDIEEIPIRSNMSAGIQPSDSTAPISRSLAHT